MLYKMEETMLKLKEICHNHYPSRVKLLAKNIRCGIRVIDNNGCKGIDG